MSIPTTEAGAARERTSLAWRRTALAFALNGALLLRASDAWVEVAGIGVLAAAAAIAAASAASFRDPDADGWLAGRAQRGGALVVVAAAVGVLDLIAVSR